MKRFYHDVAVRDGAILLDGRPVKTPARADLILPYPRLADGVAAEWAAQGDTIDPRAMPFTGFANAAIDRVAPDPAAFARPLAAYGESDLLCYRADDPSPLLDEERAAWDPLLDWARTRYDVHLVTTSGIVHAPQPAETIARLAAALAARSPYALAGMAPLVTIGGSLMAALAVAEGAIVAEAAFDATHVDELWQARLWGEDALAAEARSLRRGDFLNAANYLQLLD